MPSRVSRTVPEDFLGDVCQVFVGPELFLPTWRNGMFWVGKDNGRFLFGRPTLSRIIMVQWKMAGIFER